MTRPSGVTPVKALPYPGSAGTHAETPKAIQALAEAIDGNLSSIENGYRFAFWSGTIQIDGSGQSQVLVFPELKSVAGGIVSYGNFAGGIYRVGWASAVYQSKFSMMAANQSIMYPPGSQETFFNQTVSACVAAWGPPA